MVKDRAGRGERGEESGEKRKDERESKVRMGCKGL